MRDSDNRTPQLCLDPGHDIGSTLRFLQEEGIPLVTQDPIFLQLLDKVIRISSSDVPVLILGETGVGKELVAKALHVSGKRARHPFIAVNAAELSDTLGTSLLFGHKKGAFTDAREDRRGLVEKANGGTLFLDEIADLKNDVQSQLLRFLDNQKYRPVGASSERQARIRLVSATNKPLDRLIMDGRFRLDLFHRLAGTVLTISPLRERPGDIAIIAEYYARKYGIRIPQGLLEKWARGYWEGNVRQLIGRIQSLKWNPKGAEAWKLREFAISPQIPDQKAISDIGHKGAVSISLRDSVRNFEKGLIQSALQHCRGNVSRAATCLSISRTTLISKINRLGLGTGSPEKRAG